MLNAQMTNRQKQLLTKLVRKEFFENSSIEFVRDTIDRMKRHFSKEFWSTIKTVIKYDKKATIAVGFKQKIDQESGEITEAMSFKDYIECLYKKIDNHQEMKRPVLEEERIIVTDKELEWAFNTLKSNKAVGVDGLPDFVLK
jgi:RNase H-fold protein (predicted Holliday junction resolvase)